MSFQIPTSKIRDELNKTLQNNIGNNHQNQNYFEKKLEELKKEKTTTINVLEMKKNFTINYDNDSLNYNIDSEENNFYNKSKEENYEKNNKNNRLFNSNKSYSTECSSVHNNSELIFSNNSNLDINSSTIKKKLEFSIDINGIKDEGEEKIEEEIKNIKDPNLNDYQKRKIILERDITLTQDLRIINFFINIEAINKLKENSINEQINSKQDLDNFNNFEKREKIIKDDKTTTDNLKKIGVHDESSFINYDLVNNSNSFAGEQSTKWDTNADISEVDSSNQELEQPQIIKSFNSTKASYYIKYKLYDILLYEKADKEIKKNISEIYRIDSEKVGFLNSNDRTTNFITKSAYLGEQKFFNELSEKEKESRILYIEVGLYFCGKEVKLENIKELKKCSPNEFMCKNCMDINKKKYNIKNHYLINIKGRVSKINKNHYHCFGHFLYGTQIEDCVNKFSCEACKMLDSISSYYNN
jgi:hypothetical protein